MSGPGPSLTTARLELRPFAADDSAVLLAQWNDPVVRRYLFDDQPVSEAQVAEQLAASRAGFATLGIGFFTLRLRETPDRVVGFAGLRRFGALPRVELLYALLPDWHGRGLATEASHAILALGFERAGLDEIWAGADPPNLASFRVMERLGMTFVEEITLHGRPARYYALRRGTIR